MSKVLLFISLLCLNVVQMFLLFRYAQMSRYLPEIVRLLKILLFRVESLTEEEKEDVYV